MLVARADYVDLVLKDGRKIACPKRACLLYDASGKFWSSSSLLIMSIQRGRRAATDDEVDSSVRAYFGRDYEVRVGSVSTPPKPIGDWTLVGEVTEILYNRFGDRAPGTFKHTFNKARGLYRIVGLVKGKRRVLLYKRGSAWRVELGARSLVSDLGLIWP